MDYTTRMIPARASSPAKPVLMYAVDAPFLVDVGWAVAEDPVPTPAPEPVAVAAGSVDVMTAEVGETVAEAVPCSTS